MQAAGTTGSAEIARPSLRDGLHDYTQSPWCAGLVGHHIATMRFSRIALDTSIGVSGRCDFTSARHSFVGMLFEPAANTSRPPLPASRVVTIARNAPSE